jgi:hypothetical protein
MRQATKSNILVGYLFLSAFLIVVLLMISKEDTVIALESDGRVTVHERDWWGRTSKRYVVQLVDCDDWPDGGYRALAIPEQFDWFIVDGKGNCWPWDLTQYDVDVFEHEGLYP